MKPRWYRIQSAHNLTALSTINTANLIACSFRNRQGVGCSSHISKSTLYHCERWNSAHNCFFSMVDFFSAIVAHGIHYNCMPRGVRLRQVWLVDISWRKMRMRDIWCTHWIKLVPDENGINHFWWPEKRSKSQWNGKYDTTKVTQKHTSRARAHTQTHNVV